MYSFRCQILRIRQLDQAEPRFSAVYQEHQKEHQKQNLEKFLLLPFDSWSDSASVAANQSLALRYQILILHFYSCYFCCLSCSHLFLIYWSYLLPRIESHQLSYQTHLVHHHLWSYQDPSDSDLHKQALLIGHYPNLVKKPRQTYLLRFIDHGLGLGKHHGYLSQIGLLDCFLSLVELSPLLNYHWFHHQVDLLYFNYHLCWSRHHQKFLSCLYYFRLCPQD